MTQASHLQTQTLPQMEYILPSWPKPKPKPKSRLEHKSHPLLHIRKWPPLFSCILQISLHKEGIPILKDRHKAKIPNCLQGHSLLNFETIVLMTAMPKKKNSRNIKQHSAVPYQITLASESSEILTALIMSVRETSPTSDPCRSTTQTRCTCLATALSIASPRHDSAKQVTSSLQGLLELVDPCKGLVETFSVKSMTLRGNHDCN